MVPPRLARPGGDPSPWRGSNRREGYGSDRCLGLFSCDMNDIELKPPPPASLVAALVEAAEDAIVTTTPAGVVTGWNRAAERIFGYAAAEMIGRPVALLAPPGRAAEMDELLARIGRGEEVVRCESERRRKDGRVFPVALTVAPIRDAAGGLIGVLRITRDISIARAATAAWREDAAQLRAILDTVPEGLIIIDERGIVQSFSVAAERMFGYAAAEVLGRNVNMLMPSPYREHHDGYIARYLASGERRIIGLGRVVSGQQRTLRRLQELQAELAQVSRLTEMGQMAAGLAHEVNQPLTAAANYLQAGRRLLGGGADRPRRRADRAAARVRAPRGRRAAGREPAGGYRGGGGAGAGWRPAARRAGAPSGGGGSAGGGGRQGADPTGCGQSFAQRGGSDGRERAARADGGGRRRGGGDGDRAHRRYRPRHCRGDRRPAVSALCDDQDAGSGGRIVDLPVDRRRPWRPPVGRAQPRRRSRLLVYPSCRAVGRGEPGRRSTSRASASSACAIRRRAAQIHGFSVFSAKSRYQAASSRNLSALVIAFPPDRVRQEKMRRLTALRLDLHQSARSLPPGPARFAIAPGRRMPRRRRCGISRSGAAALRLACRSCGRCRGDRGTRPAPPARRAPRRSSPPRRRSGAGAGPRRRDPHHRVRRRRQTALHWPRAAGRGRAIRKRRRSPPAPGSRPRPARSRSLPSRRSQPPRWPALRA